MFCQLARLRQCLLPRIRQALDELPKTLDETYERTFLDIHDENWEYAHRLFQCIVVARRPLLVEELAEFLAFKSEAGGSLTFDGNWRPENARDTVLSTCSSLIAIVNVEGSQVIQFSHFSVKEYLTSNRTAEGCVSRYYIPLEPAHLFVTRACLSLLLQLDDHVTKETIEELPLARYAGRYWTDHAEFGNVSSHTEDLIKRIFHPENHHFANWVWIYDTISGYSMEGPSRPMSSPLHHAARHGFHQVAEWLIITFSQGVNVSSDCGGMQPLHVASVYGQFMVVQVLLTHQADANGRTEGNWTPLHTASYNGNSKIARLLLEHGADVNSKTHLGSTPLFCASESGLHLEPRLEVAQVLLEHGADPGVRSITGKESIYVALEEGPNGLAQLLLKHGADPNTRDDNGRTLLHVASEYGDTEVAQGLLELGVNLNSRDNEGRTPLQVALDKDNEQVVQILLQHGAQRT